MVKPTQETEFCLDDIVVDQLLDAVGNDSSGAWVVTNAQKGDGTTTVLLALGRSLTLRGKRVLVIDAHLRDPDLHRRLNVPQSPGLIEVVAESCALDEAIRQASGFHILPAGCGEMDPSRVVTAMETLLTELKKQFDCILIDTPSMEVSLDAKRLASLADSVVLVVCAGKTVERAARNARKSLTDGNAKVAGVILNRYRDYLPHFL